MTPPGPATHIVVMGVSGTGKTTVATALRDLTGRSFAEADDFHPAANVEKMRAGIPLDDDDRAPWLARLAEWMTRESDAGRSTVITCSALKRSYRDILRSASGTVFFAHLSGSAEVIAERITHRTGHFMPVSLLPSQLGALEELAPDEAGHTYTITGEPELIAAAVLQDALNPTAAGDTP